MANQIRYILKRIVYSFITILVLTSVTFLLMQLLPGDPFTGGKDIPDTVMEALKAKYGLDKPVLQQLLMYIGNALQGDFGISIPDGREVTDIIREAFPVSFDLGIRALLFAFIMGILLGIVAAVKRGTAWDSGAMFLALVGVSVPSFIMGAILQYFLALKLGQATGTQVFAIVGWTDWHSKILPAFALAFGSMVWRLTEVAEVLDATLVDMRFVKPLDEEAVLKAAAEHDLLVTAEEGIKAGGAGSAVLEFLSEAGQTTRTLIFGIPDVFIDHGDTEVLMTRSGLDPAHIRAKIEAALS